MMVIDASNQVMGRLASFVAKSLLSGEEVSVVNAEQAVIVGSPKATIEEYKERRARGDPYHGPFYPRSPERILKRAVRGMIPYKTGRGREAFKRLRVFNSIPPELQGKEAVPVKGAANSGEQKSVKLGELVKRI
jgi:large subunit ribosomal protein L13